MTAVRRIVIAGGGTAGWLTAGVLAARFRPPDADGLSITLVESANIPSVGVGEGTWPGIRDTLQAMGLAERDVLTQCDASFKQASRFRDWLEPGHVYDHPFMTPRRFEEVSLADAWLENPQGLSFADYVSFQSALCDQDRAPKTLATPDFQPVANYAYHLDAAKFAAFLRGHCTQKLGVRHVTGDIATISADDTGYITALNLADGATVEGDLFVDCTGFQALLVGRHYGSPLTDVRDQLFVDTALAVQVPYDSPDAPIRSATLSTAQSAGWIWDIGLPTRRGTGYVYSSAFSDEDTARAALAAYLGPQGGGAHIEARKIAINTGYRARPWVRNCVAAGLSMGFVEPLEASSIVMIELVARDLADQFPADRADMAVLERRFNDRFAHRWRAIIDFLKLHYVLSRRDEPFWIENRRPETLTASLADLLQLWKTRTPAPGDLARRAEIFPTASYQYVLYGMGYETLNPAWRLFDHDHRRVQLARDEVERAKLSIGQLPTNRAFLQALEPHAKKWPPLFG